MQEKLLYIIIFIIVLSITCPVITWGQSWQTLNGPIESEVTDIVVQNDTVYAAASVGKGLYKRSLNSEVWQFSNIVQGEGGLRQSIDGILSINIDQEGNYYVGGGGVVTGDRLAWQQFYRSTDYGETWQEFRNGIEECHTVNNILITPENELLITCRGVILLFNDENNSFESISGFEWGFVNTLYSYENKILSGTQNGLWYSDDNGLNWTEIENGELEIFAIIRFEDEFIIGTDNGLFRIGELNETWEEVVDLSGQIIHDIHPFEDSIFVAAETGIYMINADDYSTAEVFPDIYEESLNVINSSDSELFIGSEAGFYICSIEQNTCTLDGLPSAWIRSLNFQGQDTLLTSTTNGVYRYFTESEEWDTQSVPVRRIRNIVPIDEENFHTVDDYNYFRCSFATGECESFEIDENHVIRDITDNSAGQLFVASSRYVYQSDDGGDTWDIIYTNPNSNFTLKADGDSLLFINGAIKLSLDTLEHEQLSASIHHITSDGQYYGMGNSGVEKSNDFGETWSTLLRSSDIIEPDFIRSVEVDEVNEKIYAITNTGRIYVSENEGENWGLNNEMRPIAIEQTAIGPDGTLYLGSFSAGVFKNILPINPPITISNEIAPGPDEEVSGEFTLYQNYPNPFNPVTAITYSLSEPIEVKLTVYNMVGQEITVLFNGLQNQGVHRMEFDASHLASGIYLYKLETGNFTETRKMTLVK